MSISTTNGVELTQLLKSREWIKNG
jgi:ribosome-associated protein YbcJ (S4-like RNA binding protein)